jgi:uncharacterized damage-inducible protein DinB
MTQQRDSIRNHLALHEETLGMALAGVTDENAHNRPGDICNSAHFVFGHIVTSRIEMARILGVDASKPWGEVFDYKASLKDRSAYPPLKDIHAAWDEITEKISRRLAEITDDELNAEGPFEVPPLGKTVGGCVNFYIFHEAYHIGQLGYVRRFNGLEAAFG